MRQVYSLLSVASDSRKSSSFLYGSCPSHSRDLIAEHLDTVGSLGR